MIEKDETPNDAYMRMVKENHDFMVKHVMQQAEFDSEMRRITLEAQLEIQKAWSKGLLDYVSEKITVAM